MVIRDRLEAAEADETDWQSSSSSSSSSHQRQLQNMTVAAVRWIAAIKT